VTALLLVAHGSTNAESNAVTARIARRCAGALPGDEVVATYLDHARPSPVDALRRLAAAGVRHAVAVPLLFTPAYHVRVDLPRAVATVEAEHPRLAVQVTGPLLAPPPGPEPDADWAGLHAALDARLQQALATAGTDADALVLASAGTSDAAARATLAAFADAWAARHGLPVRAAYASAAAPDPGAAVTALRAAGAHRVAVGSLFLGPGTLPDRARTASVAAGAVAVADHLGDDDAVVALVLTRLAGALGQVRRPA
jgi:sirohydrochlorin ferrochelatase